MHPIWASVDLGAMAKKGYSAFPQSFSITGASPSDCLVPYPGHSLWGGDSYPSARKQSVYSTALVNWEKTFWYNHKNSFFLFNGISTFWDYLIKKAIIVEEL